MAKQAKRKTKKPTPDLVLHYFPHDWFVRLDDVKKFIETNVPAYMQAISLIASVPGAGSFELDAAAIVFDDIKALHAAAGNVDLNLEKSGRELRALSTYDDALDMTLHVTMLLTYALRDAKAKRRTVKAVHEMLDAVCVRMMQDDEDAAKFQRERLAA